jgi:hypothetical protein
VCRARQALRHFLEVPERPGAAALRRVI